MLLTIKNLTFGWQNEPLFENVNCQLERGEIVLLRGENGSGKTTFLQLSAGMIPHFSRGKILEGDIQIDNRSLIENPPKSFFPQIAFIPGKNIDFFLLNENLEQEMALIQAVLKIGNSAIQRKKNELQELFPEIDQRWTKNFDEMTVYQKILALTTTYYLQAAQLFLFDEILNTVPNEDLSRWMNFFRLQSQAGCGIIFISHKMEKHHFKEWEIRNKMLITTC